MSEGNFLVKMVKRLIVLILFLIFFSILINNRSQSEDLQHNISAKEILEKSEQAVRGDTQISIIEITIRTKEWSRTMELKSFDSNKEKKFFGEIYLPKKDAGNRFLMVNKNVYHYIPKLAQTIKISPSMMLQNWMGSDFTYDDIIKESDILNDYSHTVLGMENIDNYNCYKVELIPEPEVPVVWGKIIFYIREKDFLPVKKEYYNEHDILKKVLSFSKFQKMDDRIIPTLYKMQTVSKKGNYTLLEIKEVDFDSKIPEKVFSLQYLKKR